MIAVSSLNHLVPVVRRTKPSHILSLLSPNQDAPREIRTTQAAKLHLSFNDITEARPDLIMPSAAIVEEILTFSRSWSDEQPLLVHCWAGISRSSAAAYIIACDRNPDREEEIAIELRRRAPFATPNRLMIELADDILARNGRMTDSIRRIGRGADAFEGNPYELPTRWPL